jgi:predicted AlkP superfamily phosphohydrolase/phosphomutase
VNAFTPPARLVVLGIDAASPDLIDQWISDESLPNLAGFAARSLRGRTRGIDGFFIGSTWPSFYTGSMPAGHGVHYLVELVPGTYEWRFAADGAFVRRPAFWHVLSEAGKRVAVLDVPLTRIDPGLRGVQVVEWGGHDALYGLRSTPEHEARDLVARFGVHPLGGSCDADGRGVADYATLVERMEQGARLKGEWTCDLLARGGWDLFMQVFTEGHCAGHQCWHLHDRTHPAHDSAIAAALGDPLRRVYRAIDRAIGDVLAAAGDTRVVIFSAHGMAHWYGAQFLLQEILVRLGAAEPLPVTPPTTAARARSLAASAWRRIPGFVRQRIPRPHRPPAEPALPALTVDGRRSRCFPHPNGLAVGGIRLNLVGREPTGVLRPGADAEDFIAWLTRALLDIRDERTGGPLVSRVLRSAELGRGENLDLLPDLLVEWTDAVPTGSRAVGAGAGARVRVSSPLIGVLEGENDFGRTGEHRPGGWFAVAGPGIAPGHLDHQPALIDLAPTLTALLGVPFERCDGRPIEAIVGASVCSSGS